MCQASPAAAIPPTGPAGAAILPETGVASPPIATDPAQAVYLNNGPLDGAPKEQANTVNHYMSMAEKAKQR